MNNDDTVFFSELSSWDKIYELFDDSSYLIINVEKGIQYVNLNSVNYVRITEEEPTIKIVKE